MTDTNGVSFDFSYDPVDNRLSQEVVLCECCQAQTTDYTYTNNKLSSITTSSRTVELTWDANGNRLVSVTEGQTTVTMAYRCNGLSRDAWGTIGCESDRVSQTVNGVTTRYVLDQASELTQVLSDGTNKYI